MRLGRTVYSYGEAPGFVLSKWTREECFKSLGA